MNNTSELVITTLRTNFASLKSDLPNAPFFSSPSLGAGAPFFLNKFAVSIPNITAITLKFPLLLFHYQLIVN